MAQLKVIYFMLRMDGQSKSLETPKRVTGALKSSTDR